MTFALLATVLAVMGHALGGGELPDPAVTLVVAALLAGSTGSLFDRARGFGPTVGGLAVAQLLFHSLFLVAAHHSAPVDLPRMVLFHGIAAVLTALVLTRADAAAATVGRAIRRLVRTLLLPRTPELTLAPATPVRITVPVGARLTGPVSRRGPPVVTAA
jgi:hypothetical protein